MFKWYFSDNFIENQVLFWVGLSIIVLIILVTVFLVYKELKRDKHVSK